MDLIQTASGASSSSKDKMKDKAKSKRKRESTRRSPKPAKSSLKRVEITQMLRKER